LTVAKPTPLPDRLGTEKADLFEELVPVSIHQVFPLEPIANFSHNLKNCL